MFLLDEMLRAAHQCFHGKCIYFLTLRFPVVTHDFRLVLIRDRQFQIYQAVFSFPDLTVDDVVLAGGFIEISGYTHLVAETELVLF